MESQIGKTCKKDDPQNCTKYGSLREVENFSVTCLTGQLGWRPATVEGGRSGRSYYGSAIVGVCKEGCVVICLPCYLPRAGGWLSFTSC